MMLVKIREANSMHPTVTFRFVARSSMIKSINIVDLSN